MLHASMSITTGRIGSVPISKSACLALQPKPLRLSLGKVPWLISQHANSLRRHRWYTTTTQGKSTSKSQSFACTWLTKTPDEIVSDVLRLWFSTFSVSQTNHTHRKIPDDVLASLPPIPAPLAESGNIPVILVTPSFAPWIDPASPFLEQCVNRLFEHTPDIRSLSPFYAVAAIIDKLPDTRWHSGDKPINGNGHGSTDSDGISLLFVKEEGVRGKAAAPRRLKSSGTDETVLIFSVDTPSSNASGRSTQGSVHEVGLRLANTIFVNGNDNTLFGMRWTYDPKLSRLRLDQSVDLSNCTITSTANAVHDNLDFPLFPVGQRRKVISGMGNILRQVAKSAEDDQSNTPMPASLELEKEIPRYIEEHDIDDPLVSVWALVETPDIAVPTGFENPQDRLSHALRVGGKLHHVMSGGGGWGKKQGLLSLDPEITFSDAADRRDFLALDQLFDPGGDFARGLPPFLTQETTGDDLSDLHRTAKPGDYVQFFVSVQPSHSQNAHSSLTTSQGSILCQFGVVAHAGIPEIQTIDGQQKDLAVVPSYFGALSEKAITYLQPVTNPQTIEQLETGTKLDMPGCRVNLVLE